MEMETVRRMSHHRTQPLSFAAERRPSSSESFGTIRRKFLNAPLPEPTEEDENYRPPQDYSPLDDKKKKKKKKGTKVSFDPNNDDREEQRLQELKEWLNMDTDKSGRHHELKIAMLKHMRVLDDLGKLKAHYYLQYMDALTDKVEEQRKEIHRKSEVHKQKLMRREKKEKKDAQRVKVEMHRPQLSSDNSFLRGLPKTHYHKMVVLQDRLAREGHLRHDEDVRAFWREVQRPEVYHQMFGASEDGRGGGREEGAYWTETRTGPAARHDGEQTGTDPDSQASASESLPDGQSSSLSSLHQGDPSHGGSLAQIQEVREPSRPDSMGGPYVQSWISQPKHKKRHSQAIISRRPVHPKVLEMEARCPQVEFPRLAAYTLDLEPPQEDPAVEGLREAFRSRARLRQAEVRRLHKMYQNSITNCAATKRIFDMKDELMLVVNGPPLCDVLHAGNPSEQQTLLLEGDREERSHKEIPALPPPEITAPSHNRMNPRVGSNPGSRHAPSFPIERISEEGDIDDEEDEDTDLIREEEEEEGRQHGLLTYSSRSSSRRSSLTSTESEIRRNAPVIAEPKRPHPLTLDAVMDKAKVKVVDCPSTLWINYGKFLPSVR